MILLRCILLVCFLSGCHTTQKEPDFLQESGDAEAYKKITSGEKLLPLTDFYRLEEVSRVIDKTGERFWPAIKGFRGPWVYATADGQYVFNLKKDLEGYRPALVGVSVSGYFKGDGAQWFPKSQFTLDGVDNSSEPVFVFNSVSTNAKDIDFNNPILYTSSFEVVGKAIPFADTEDWMSLFLHEAFHQFQFSQPSVFAEYKKLKDQGLYFDSSELAKIFETNTWYKNSILRENRLLIKARKTANRKKKEHILKQFSRLRLERRSRYQAEFGKNLTSAETLWEMLEGGARYFEYGTFRTLKDLPPNQKLADVDRHYGKNKRYKNGYSTGMMEDLDKDKKRTRYFYTTGFNLYLLLEELRPGFQNLIFKRAPGFAEALLFSASPEQPK